MNPIIHLHASHGSRSTLFSLISSFLLLFFPHFFFSFLLIFSSIVFSFFLVFISYIFLLFFSSIDCWEYVPPVGGADCSGQEEPTIEDKEEPTVRAERRESKVESRVNNC